MSVPTSDIWIVYGLIDPETKHVFYVGMTVNLPKRIIEHSNNPASGARSMIRKIKSRGLEVQHCIFGMFNDKRLAEFLERELSELLPNLFNEHGFKRGRELWKNIQRAHGITTL